MNRVYGLEGMRGYLAIWVWVTHVTTMATLAFGKYHGWGWMLANGDTAVGVFIVISGFVISSNLDLSSENYGQYLVRRAFRLFPVYLVCLFVSVLILDYSIEVMQNMPWDGLRTDDRILYLTESKKNFWTHLGLHLFLLHGLVPDALLKSTSYAFIGQAWSLTLEWQFYLVAPVLFMLAKRIKLGLSFIVITLGMLIALANFSTQGSFLLSKLYLFFIGHASYRIYKEVSHGRMSKGEAILFFGVLALMSLVRWRQGLGALGWSIIFVALYFIDGPIHRFVKWFFTNRFAEWLGRMSYSFYCVHMIVLFMGAKLLIDGMGVQSRPLYATLLICGTLPAALLAAWALNKFVENPMIATGKKISKKKFLSVHKQSAPA